MDISLIIEVAGVGLLVAIAAQLLSKSGRDEQASFVIIAGVIVVFLLLVERSGDLFDTVRGIFGF